MYVWVCMGMWIYIWRIILPAQWKSGVWSRRESQLKGRGILTHAHTLCTATCLHLFSAKKNALIIHHNWKTRPKWTTMKEKHFINANGHFKMSINCTSLFFLPVSHWFPHKIILAQTLPLILGDYLFENRLHCL